MISVEFANEISSSTIACLHGCCSLISVVRMKRMIQTGDILDTVGNNHSIIVFAHTTVSMGVKLCMEVTL